MKKAIVALVIATLIVTVGVTASGAPKTPRLVDSPSGTYPANWPSDFPKPGELTPVSDANGDLIRCPDGTLLRVEVGAQAPAGVGESVVRTKAKREVNVVTDGVVPRCGPGGGDDPVWVPSSIGANRVTAPARFVR